MARKLSKEEKDKCKVVTPKFRVSYPHIFKPQKPIKEGDSSKYSIVMLFPKTTDLKPLKRVLHQAKLFEYGPKESWPARLEDPIRDGDGPDFIDEETGKTKEGYAGQWVIKATSNDKSKPGLVDANSEPILNEADFYSGCYARAQLLAYTWAFGKKKGVGFILDHVQKWADGKPFGGKAAASDVFQPLEVELDGDEDFENEENFY